MSDRWLHIVLIEWDGGQPPSHYYRRLHKLAFKVRGDKEIAPLARRDTGQGVIFQEGAVITASETLARTIAGYATDEGAVNVSIGRVQLDDTFTRTPQDAAILNRIEQIMGKRGKRPPEELWAVACTECVQLNSVTHWAPINCPNCGGLLVHARRGQVTTYADPGGDILSAWKRTRFTGPHWEPAPIHPTGDCTPATVTILSDKERDAVELIEGSPALLDKLRRMPRDTAISFLDGIMINRAYRGREARQAARIEAATAYFMRDGNPAAFKINEQALPDLVDATAALGPSVVVTWLLQPGMN